MNDAAPGTRLTPAAEAGRLLLIAMAVTAVLVPLLWIAFAAFRTPADLTNPGSFAIDPTLDNMRDIAEGGIPGAALRSIIVGFAVTIIGVFVGALAGYSIARFRTGGIPLRFAILFPTIIPPTVLAFPLLALALQFNLSDSLIAVIAAHLTIVVPMITWFMTGFFASVPREVEEQAAIDGYGPFAAFWRVVVPNVLPGLGASALLAFMMSWNELFYALVLAPGSSQTLPVAISGFNTFQGVKLGPMSAALLLTVAPVMVLSFVIQKRLVRGLGGSGVKG
ncbi:carbohydrate ABC transporter permease [Taklimakanibacter deserti]|uniref:carbohydrate ABC transporter permease n=1 Tax=Taklimakanibacter deserti TaxID=2267839 RepID=UPI000E65CA0A